jgi:hypothetical protein
MPDVGVIAMVYHVWSPIYLTQHHVLTRLAEYFNVVWMNPARPWRQSLRSRRRLLEAPDETLPGFQVVEPPTFSPTFFKPSWLADLTFDRRLERAARALRRRGCTKLILYMWYPEFQRAVTTFSADLSCYHIDDEYSYSPEVTELRRSEEQLIRAVDQVFITSPEMLAKKGALNPATERIPHGVDYVSYATPRPEPADLAKIPHPRIGYTGHLKRQLDWSLLESLVSRHPEWQFVFVGPTIPQSDVIDAVRRLGTHRNVHLLGPKPVSELAGYPQHFDVCIMPYRLDPYTKFVSPLKLHEYLATGQPTVGSPLPSLREFDSVLSLPTTPEEWSTAIAEALSPTATSEACAEERRSAARAHDWQLVIRRIARSLAGGLGPDQGRRLDALLSGEHPVVAPAAASEAVPRVVAGRSGFAA